MREAIPRSDDDGDTDPESAERERLLELVKFHTRELMKHFDSVQFFGTLIDPNDGATDAIDHGAGNWYARYGQVVDWLTATEARTADHATRDDV